MTDKHDYKAAEKYFSQDDDFLSDNFGDVVLHKDAIKSALEKAQKYQWQPIETAPKDGTVIPIRLCSRKNYPHEWHKAYFAANGEWYVHEIGYLTEDYLSNWMPLPEPPTIKGD